AQTSHQGDPMGAPTPPAYDLRERITLIAGGLGGAGQPVTRGFLEAGATVVIGDMAGHEARFAALRTELGTDGERLFYEPVDLLEEAEVEALIARILQQHQRLDILVNLVGGWQAGQPITNTDLALWQRMLDLNLRPAFLLS